MAHSSQPNPVVVDTSTSPFARLRPVSLTAVTLTDDFWASRLRLNREVTLPAQHRFLGETGRVDNFRRAAGKREGAFKGWFFNDSDIYKWLEAAAWTLATGDDPQLVEMVDGLIGVIEVAQEPDGYLDTYFAFERAADRWTNLRDLHELYCAGHLIQAAIAHRRATGSPRLLAVARRLADHIVRVFRPGSGRPGTPGHPEIEMALVELARLTGEPVYRHQAQSFVDNRGRGLIGGREYHLDHVPLRDMQRLAGHAVRALYLCAGAADLVAESGEPALRQALDRLWAVLMTGQVYISGGVGSRHEGEAIGAPYELPNERAYAETCAAIANVMWNWRMLALEPDARYADALETALYNGVLPGLSLDGLGYFYENPLASDGTHRRQPWFDCACCPPNVARLLASLPGHVYSLSDAGLWVHLYAGGRLEARLLDGRPLNVTQHSRYPWDGEVSLEVGGAGTFSLFLHIPAWCAVGTAGVTLEVNGRAHDDALLPGSYAEVRRTWQLGDVVRLHLPMPVRRLASHPYVTENAGRVALMRGPLLYCVEQAGQPELDPRHLVLPPLAAGELAAEFRPGLLGGVVVLHGRALLAPPDAGWQGRLYRTVAGDVPAPADQPVDITAIPYYAWANREPGRMQVWLRQSERANA